MTAAASARIPDGRRTKNQILAFLFRVTHGHDPRRKMKSRQPPGGGSGAGVHEDGCGQQVFQARLDADSDQMLRPDPASKIDAGIHLLDRHMSSRRLHDCGNTCQHGDRFDRVAPHGGLAGEHHTVSAVEDRVRYVRRLGARGQSMAVIDSSICVAVMTGFLADWPGAWDPSGRRLSFRSVTRRPDRRARS